MTKNCALTLLLAAGVLAGCGKRDQADTEASNETAPSPEERKYLIAAEPFLDAIVTGDYAAAHAQLSPHAVARMSLNQFAPSNDDKQFERNEANAIKNVTPEQFLDWMQKAEAAYGKPVKFNDAHVHSMDPQVLAGKAEPIETMFAIGNMPASVPVDIRRARLRCQLGVKLSAAQLQEAAQARQTSAEQLQKDPDFAPYCNLKLVLVEESGALKVGYFEFLPPSMLD
ncbi:MAG: hypothetical protein L0Y58_21950 [Verrucomicrobia subdivision 3 bacterium]|nr:hypothetical protein [Limisphaerales bacterium]